MNRRVFEASFELDAVSDQRELALRHMRFVVSPAAAEDRRRDLIGASHRPD